jgi:DNA-directed RNA polymerase subunit RPC12/RpoP
VADKPDVVSIRCESCKRESSLAEIHRTRAVCSQCQNDTWHLQAVYLGRQDTPGGAGLALNAIGLGGFVATDLGFSLPGLTEKQAVNGYDIHDVPAAELVEASEPSAKTSVKLIALVMRKYNQQLQLHRQQMEDRGRECQQCGVLYVVNDKKPWTVLGTCSKVCCASQFGVSDYSLVEDDVLRQAAQLQSGERTRQRDGQVIRVACTGCGHQFDQPKMYSGIFRKCPGCGNKVKVPHH